MNILRNEKGLALAFVLILSGCAATAPTLSDSPVVPLQKANLEMVMEEQEGMEVLWENAKEVRDFYRGGVQQKVKAEEKHRAKQYPEALKLYDASNEFLLVVVCPGFSLPQISSRVDTGESTPLPVEAARKNNTSVYRVRRYFDVEKMLSGVSVHFAIVPCKGRC